MKKILSIAGFLFLLYASGFAQTSDNSTCPLISITGPEKVVRLGENANYSVQLDTKGKQHNLQYIWSVSTGKIVAGQGTTTITALMSDLTTQTVSVEIKGLPKDCPNFASETDVVDRSPQPVILDEFTGPIARIADDRFTKILNNYFLSQMLNHI